MSSQRRTAKAEDRLKGALSFTSWLSAQAERRDPVGDLARDVAKDRHAPRWSSDQHRWITHLENARAHDTALDALRRAWREWETELGIRKSAAPAAEETDE